MKREGRQHGMVRTYRILPAPLNQKTSLRFVNQIDTPPTAGLFTKVSSKPTNHTKSTGLTSSKADKSKRRNNKKHKAIFSDGVHYFSGASASGILSSFYPHENEYEDENEDQRYEQYGIERITDENYSEDEDVEEADQQLNPLLYVEEMEPVLLDQNEVDILLQNADKEQVDLEASCEDDDEIVIDEDGGAVTIGEVVILLEQVAHEEEEEEEEDWCFVES